MPHIKGIYRGDLHSGENCSRKVMLMINVQFEKDKAIEKEDLALIREMEMKKSANKMRQFFSEYQ